MMMKAWLSSLLCAVILSACGGKTAEKSSAAASPAAPAQTQKAYRVTTEMLNIPLVIRNGRDIGGFELELLQAIAERQNITLDFAKLHTWQGIFDTLDKDEADIVAGAVTYSKERAERMEMTLPHFEYEFAMLANKQAAGARGFADLRGKNVSLKRDSIAETLIPMFGAAGESNIIRTTTTWEAIKEVLAGKAASATGSSAVMYYYAKQYKNQHPDLFVLTDPSLPKRHYVFAVKKGNTELVRILNEGLAKVRADGTYDMLYRKYWH
ncbi:transporter substrate-binding domain-containing protein [Conchiformibius kuhniae]|uniref:Transporter substrate-binding domain-containing protein n=1 Tax=Conchiformibius kuhniae TaxID=211502 RepID=A0A8T9MYS5_9NEIS|nr:transporter substrate-binding domain-containing protein [Conchiformibius kuhniae]